MVITGRTASSNFPVTAGAYQVENAGSSDVFVCHTAFGLAATTTTTITTNGFIDLTVIILGAIVAIGVVMVVVLFMKRR